MSQKLNHLCYVFIAKLFGNLKVVKVAKCTLWKYEFINV